MLYNAAGRLVYKQESGSGSGKMMTTLTLPLRGLPAGTYYPEVELQDRIMLRQPIIHY